MKPFGFVVMLFLSSSLVDLFGLFRGHVLVARVGKAHVATLLFLVSSPMSTAQH